MLISYDKTEHASFGGKPLSKELYKTTVKQQLNGKKLDVGYLSAFGCGVLLCCFGVWCLSCKHFSKHQTPKQDNQKQINTNVSSLYLIFLCLRVVL